MRDPYKVLGVDPTATDDEIKTAYRNLARKYHPDRYRDSDLAEMAEEKMKEINAAYDEIQKMRSGQYTGGGYAGGQSYGGQSYGGQSYGGSNSKSNYGGGAYGGGSRGGQGGQAGSLNYIRQLINARRIDEAYQILIGIAEEYRGAEWHYLMGVISANRGHFVDAQHFFDTACGMDPSNGEYRAAADRLRNGQAGFHNGGGQTQQGSSCTVWDLCTALICADCCCDLGRLCC